MSNIKEIIKNHLRIYDELYDDHDKYFDYLYDFHNDIHEFIKERILLLLDRDKFPDFFEFCVERMNKPLVDRQIKAESVRQLHAEFRLSSNDQSLDQSLDHSHFYQQSSINEDENYDEEDENGERINQEIAT